MVHAEEFRQDADSAIDSVTLLHDSVYHEVRGFCESVLPEIALNRRVLVTKRGVIPLDDIESVIRADNWSDIERQFSNSQLYGLIDKAWNYISIGIPVVNERMQVLLYDILYEHEASERKPSQLQSIDGAEMLLCLQYGLVGVVLRHYLHHPLYRRIDQFSREILPQLETSVRVTVDGGKLRVKRISPIEYRIYRRNKLELTVPNQYFLPEPYSQTAAAFTRLQRNAYLREQAPRTITRGKEPSFKAFLRKFDGYISAVARQADVSPQVYFEERFLVLKQISRLLEIQNFEDLFLFCHEDTQRLDRFLKAFHAVLDEVPFRQGDSLKKTVLRLEGNLDEYHMKDAPLQADAKRGLQRRYAAHDINQDELRQELNAIVAQTRLRLLRDCPPHDVGNLLRAFKEWVFVQTFDAIVDEDHLYWGERLVGLFHYQRFHFMPSQTAGGAREKLISRFADFFAALHEDVEALADMMVRPRPTFTDRESKRYFKKIRSWEKQISFIKGCENIEFPAFEKGVIKLVNDISLLYFNRRHHVTRREIDLFDRIGRAVQPVSKETALKIDKRLTLASVREVAAGEKTVADLDAKTHVSEFIRRSVPFYAGQFLTESMIQYADLMRWYKYNIAERFKGEEDDDRYNAVVNAAIFPRLAGNAVAAEEHEIAQYYHNLEAYTRSVMPREEKLLRFITIMGGAVSDFSEFDTVTELDTLCRKTVAKGADSGTPFFVIEGAYNHLFFDQRNDIHEKAVEAFNELKSRGLRHYLTRKVRQAAVYSDHKHVWNAFEKLKFFFENRTTNYFKENSGKAMTIMPLRESAVVFMERLADEALTCVREVIDRADSRERERLDWVRQAREANLADEIDTPEDVTDEEGEVIGRRITMEFNGVHYRYFSRSASLYELLPDGSMVETGLRNHRERGLAIFFLRDKIREILKTYRNRQVRQFAGNALIQGKAFYDEMLKRQGLKTERPQDTETTNRKQDDYRAEQYKDVLASIDTILNVDTEED